MLINIISKNNGVGLTRDIAIIVHILKELGHETRYCEYGKANADHVADANIFVELVHSSYFSKSRCNVLIPNPEWFDFRWRHFLPRFQSVLCKTKTAYTTFSALNKKTQYISFTSADCYRPEIAKNFSKFLHVAGKSGQKGTETVFQTWRENPRFPHLTIVQDPGKFKERPNLANLTYIYDRLSDRDLLQLQNESGVHVCPSETEGFGHYIVEALSCKATVITTNASPMNEIVTPERGVFCDYVQKSKQHFAFNHYIDTSTLAASVNNILNMSIEELEKIGNNGRTFFLENDAVFNKFFREAISSLPFKRPITYTNIPRTVRK